MLFSAFQVVLKFVCNEIEEFIHILLHQNVDLLTIVTLDGSDESIRNHILLDTFLQLREHQLQLVEGMVLEQYFHYTFGFESVGIIKDVVVLLEVGILLKQSNSSSWVLVQDGFLVGDSNLSIENLSTKVRHHEKLLQ
jgi:hypothetical protein